MSPSRTILINRSRNIFPRYVEIDLPRDDEEARQRKEILGYRYDEILGEMPEKCDLEPEEQSRRHLSTYTEVKLTYKAEESDIVSAYLLIPRSNEPPFPGIVAHHQCNIDCDLGKEAVVGKIPDRADQVYGLELVRRGFVVLAPDSTNCGERFVEGIREEGECIKTEEWKHSHCWGALQPRLSTRHIYAKHLFDSVRAIDYLSSLDGLVDPESIGMIGHSLGAGTTFWTAAYDNRLKVAVSSCHYLGGMAYNGLSTWYPKKPESEGLWYHEMLELIATTPFLATRGVDEGLQGRFDTKMENLEAQRWVFDYGSYVYGLYSSAGESAVRTLIFDGGHEFPPQVREECYKFIEKYLF